LVFVIVRVISWNTPDEETSPMTAVLTPRVRTLVVCDRVISPEEPDTICDLEGVRCLISAEEFPCAPSQLWIYLLLSNPRPGTFPGYVLVVDQTNDNAIFYGRIEPTFEEDDLFVPVFLPLSCSFLHPGEYTVQILFLQRETNKPDVVKAEQPFYVL
jgi:hypothetical protein